MSDWIDEVRAHAREHPSVSVVVTTTLRPGHVSCISPVPRLFGAEVHCREEDARAVRRIISEPKPE